jgi:hypothetical protein
LLEDICLQIMQNPGRLSKVAARRLVCGTALLGLAKRAASAHWRPGYVLSRQPQGLGRAYQQTFINTTLGRYRQALITAADFFNDRVIPFCEVMVKLMRGKTSMHHMLKGLLSGSPHVSNSSLSFCRAWRASLSRAARPRLGNR